MYSLSPRKEKREQPLVLDPEVQLGAVGVSKKANVYTTPTKSLQSSPKVFTMRADAPEFHPTGQTIFACEQREDGNEEKRLFPSLQLGEEAYRLSPSSCQEESYYYLPDGLDLGPPGLNLTKPYRENGISVPEHVGAPPETPPSGDNEFAEYPDFPNQSRTGVTGQRTFPTSGGNSHKKRLLDRPPGIDTTSAKPFRDKSNYWSARVNRGSGPTGPRLSIAPKQSPVRVPRDRQFKVVKTRKQKRADSYAARSIGRGGRKQKTNYPCVKPTTAHARDSAPRWHETKKDKRCLTKGLPQQTVKHKPEKKGFRLLPKEILALKSEKPKMVKYHSLPNLPKTKPTKSRKPRASPVKKRRSSSGNMKKNRHKQRMRASTPPAQAMAMPQTPQKNENFNDVDMNAQRAEQARNVDAENGKPSKRKSKMPEKDKDVQLQVQGDDDNVDINETCATLQREIENLDMLPIDEPINELSMQLEMVLTWFVLTLERCCLVLSRFWTDSLISCTSFAFTIWYRAFQNWKQSWTFIYIYAFPFLCREIAYYVQHPVSGNALWYLYLLQDLIGAPRSNAPFCPQIIFKYGVTCGLLLLSELSSTGKYVPLPLILNSGERLVMAYLLVALKCEHFFAPSFCYRFLVAFGGLTLLAVCYGDMVIVQILILMVALYNSNMDVRVIREPQRNTKSLPPTLLMRKKLSSGT